MIKDTWQYLTIVALNLKIANQELLHTLHFQEGIFWQVNLLELKQDYNEVHLIFLQEKVA